MLLASAFVSYAGPFTSKFRATLISDCIKFLGDKGIPMTDGVADPLKVLVDDAMVAGWIRQGLPSDPTSVQNGTILTNSERWPLMMDPQLQGIVWIKERESRNNLQVGGLGWLARGLQAACRGLQSAALAFCMLHATWPQVAITSSAPSPTPAPHPTHPPGGAHGR